MRLVPKAVARAVMKVRKSVAQRGLIETARHTLRIMGGRLPEREVQATAEHWDREFGVETARHEALEDLSIDSPNELFGTHYEPVGPRRFHELLAHIPVTWQDYTFVDLGSGKGRALLLAAAFPFRRIVGVEFAQELHATAVKNIETYTGPRACREIASLAGDATEFDFPREPMLLFLYNPFETRVLARVFENLRRSLGQHPREVWVAYYAPEGLRLPPSAAYLTLVHDEAGFGVYRAAGSRHE